MTQQRALLLTAAFLLTLTGTSALAAKPHGWFVGGGISMFELAGAGDISTPDGSVDFDLQRRNAYGLITNSVLAADEDIGFGWENSQLPGARFTMGYRHNDQFVTHMGFFWALPKNQELTGYPNPNNDGTYEYLKQQSTYWTQSSFRLMLDWTPFEPLPLWFFTAGLEYVSFDTRIEVIWEGVDNTLPQYRRFENYQDSGNAVGGVIGTGLQFASDQNANVEWYVQIQYSWVPFSDTFYAWDAEFLVGGVALEGGMRVFLGGDE